MHTGGVLEMHDTVTLEATLFSSLYFGVVQQVLRGFI